MRTVRVGGAIPFPTLLVLVAILLVKYPPALPPGPRDGSGGDGIPCPACPDVLKSQMFLNPERTWWVCQNKPNDDAHRAPASS